MEKDVWVIIPARYNSSRFAGKVIYPILGRPMLWYVWKVARDVVGEDRVIIATDNKMVSDVVSDFGGRVVLTSSDCKSGTDRVAEVVRNLGINGIIINLQADEPTMKKDVLAEFIKFSYEIEYMGSAYTRGKKEDFDNPNVVKVVINKNKEAIYFSRAPIPFDRQKRLEGFFYQHIGIYSYTSDAILDFVSLGKSFLEEIECLEQLRAIEYNRPIKMFKTEYWGVGVDVIEDVAKVEEVLKSYA